MTRALGSNAIVKFCQEETWGTTPTTPANVFGISLRSESLGSTKNIFQTETISQYRSVSGLGDGNKAVAGNIIMDFLPEGLEVLVRHLLGAPTVTTSGSDPYTHEMKGQKDYLQGLSIEKGYVNISQYMKYVGCRINSMTINLVQEGFHEVTFDFIGKQEVTGTSTQITGSADFPTKSGFTGYQCGVYTDNAVAGTFVLLGSVISGSISINNNFETDGYVLGSEYRASALPGRRECSGDFTLFFEDLVLYNLYVNGTECGLKFYFTTGETLPSTLGALAADAVEIFFPIVKFGGESPKIASQGGLNLPLNFQARRDGTTELTDVVFTFVNSTATVETGIGEP